VGSATINFGRGRACLIVGGQGGPQDSFGQELGSEREGRRKFENKEKGDTDKKDAWENTGTARGERFVLGEERAGGFPAGIEG